MTFDGLLAQHERCGDLAVTLGERHQTQDFYLAPGQIAKGAPGEATCSIRGRRRLIAGERIGDGPVQRQRAPLTPGGFGGSLAETPCGNLQPPVESLTVRWKRDGPDRLSQSARGFSQAEQPMALEGYSSTSRSKAASRAWECLRIVRRRRRQSF